MNIHFHCTGFGEHYNFGQFQGLIVPVKQVARLKSQGNTAITISLSLEPLKLIDFEDSISLNLQAFKLNTKCQLKNHLRLRAINIYDIYTYI